MAAPRLRSALALVLLPASLAATSADTETHKLTSAAGAVDDGLGHAVSVSGDVIVSGSRRDHILVHRWNGTGWVEEQRITASDGQAGDSFGSSVSVHGAVLVAGSPNDDDGGLDSGSAYVFRWNGTAWIEEQKLTASNGLALDAFGISVAVDADAILVGASGRDTAASNAGSAYVFRWNGAAWVEEQELSASDAVKKDFLGRSVALSGSVAAVGAPFAHDPAHSAGGDAAGRAYVFRWSGSTWVEEQILAASDGQADDEFGISVAIEGNVIVVGASEDDDAGPGSGSAYAYRWNGASWAQQKKLVASDAGAGDHFGFSLDVAPGLAVIGAPDADPGASGPGAAYVVRSDGFGWIESKKVIASDGQVGDGLGGAVAADGDRALAGAPRDDHVGGFDAGAVYVFDLSPDGGLAGAPGTISLAAGGAQDFDLDAGPSNLGNIYFLLGSASGTAPGFPFRAFNIPLNVDPWLMRTLLEPNFGVLVATLGALDGEGRAAARLALPPGLPSSIAGVLLNHAFGVIDPLTGRLVFVSNTVLVELLP